MPDSPAPTPLPEELAALDGAARQRVASGLWNAWRSDGASAALITGVSGAGKTDRVVRPLMARAARAGIASVQVDVPDLAEATDVDFELLSQLIGEADHIADEDLRSLLRASTNFASAARLLLGRGMLVVLDEFQRLVGNDQQPIAPFREQLAKLARRPPDDGCLWLVSNQSIEGVWAEPFYATQLEAPEEQDAVRIVLANLDQDQHEARLPTPRRIEVVRRLGANPRVLRLLGYLLRSYDLDELIGPAGELPPALPFAPVFVEDIERSLLAKAEAGLSDEARTLLAKLSILDGWVAWELLEAMGSGLEGVRTLADELRQHYLLGVRAGQYRVHPVVRETRGARLRADPDGWKAANGLAGKWFARRTVELLRLGVGDVRLATTLSGALSHLVEAKASQTLAETLTAAAGYIEQRYGWTSPAPVTSFERDARIVLLETLTAHGGSPAVHYQLAKLLRQRGARGDLEAALPAARRGTSGQDFADPWVLWIHLVQEVRGESEGVAAAEEAIMHVTPSSLSSIYQLLGGYLTWSGRPTEAVERLLEGVDRSEGNRYRLVHEALLFAAAEADRTVFDLILARVEWDEIGTTRALADALALQWQGKWRAAADAASAGREAHPGYLHLTVHESLSWLGAGEPDRAQESLDRFPWPLRSGEGTALTWLCAFVALERGDLASARHFAERFHGEPLAAQAADAIRQTLLRAWDAAPRITEPTPAVAFPQLPSAMTGLPETVRRPLYGGPVLGEDRAGVAVSPRPRRPVVLALATAWHSANGGLSTLNRQLCAALAAAGADVVCVVPASSEADRTAATAANVLLLDAPVSPGANDMMRLGRRPNLPVGLTPDVVIGHGRVTGPAAQAVAEDSFASARRVHVVHIAPDEIEWEKPDRQDDAGERAEQRTELELALAADADAVVAIGPLLHNRYLSEFSGLREPPPLLRVDPGFDLGDSTHREPPPGSPWRILVLGRAEDAQLKGLDTAAKGLGRAVRARGAQAAPVELIVRGAPAGSSEELRARLIEWADAPSLRVLVRPYSIASEQLEADLRRATLVLVPSRYEGFGLVGLEAIVAGTPVLLSNRSGVGLLLQEVLGGNDAMRFVLPVDAGEDETVAAWSTAIQAVLLDREAWFARASELRSLMAQTKRWPTAAEVLLNGLQLGS